jgi:hypothetical protein
MLKLTTTWADESLIECLVEATSETFFGKANVYFTSELLAELASKLSGFPASNGDERAFRTANSEKGNSVVITLRCINTRGHGVASVEIIEAESTGQEVRVVFPTVASSVDTFVRELRQISRDREGDAHLRDS